MKYHAWSIERAYKDYRSLAKATTALQPPTESQLSLLYKLERELKLPKIPAPTTKRGASDRIQKLLKEKLWKNP